MSIRQNSDSVSQLRGGSLTASPKPLKVLTLSSNDLSGSRFNGHDLHEGLKSRGIETTHRSFWEKSSAAPWSGQVFDRKDVKLLAPSIRRLEYRTGMQNRFQYWTSSLLKDPSFLQADIIHLNVIHDHWFRFEAIREISRRKPTVGSDAGLGDT